MAAPMTTLPRRRFKPAPPHNPLKGPAVCLCVDCCRIMLALRCPATDGEGRRCGDYKHPGNSHTMLVDTVFEIADERLRLDADTRAIGDGGKVGNV